MSLIRTFWMVLPLGFCLTVAVALTTGCSKRDADFSQQNSNSTDPDADTVATIVFSKTAGGAGQGSFSLTDTIYGRILNSGPGASGCGETFGVNDGFCQTPSNYTSMPNSDWTYDSGSMEWKATLVPGTFAEGTHKAYWKNKGAQKAAFVSFQVLAPDKPLMVAVEFPYNKPETTYLPYEAIYMQVAQAPKLGSAACTEEVGGATDGQCSTASNWADMPANGWTYSNSLGRWETLVNAGTAPLGTWRLFWKNKTTGAVSNPIIITIAPDTGPTYVFAKSPFGASETNFKTSDVIYGYVYNGDPNNAAACAEVKGESEGICNNSSSWVSMPNADWTFSATNQRWEAKFPANYFLPVEFTGWWKNMTSNKKGPGRTIKITN